MVDEVADDRDVVGADFAAGLGRCGGRQVRLQRLAGESPAWSEFSGLG